MRPPSSPGGEQLTLPILPTRSCPVCQATVPEGAFCAACGSHLLGEEDGAVRRRGAAYAANPAESVLRLSVVSSLFPHLPHRARAPFRVGFSALVVALCVLGALRLQAPVIAVGAFGVPLLFQLYLSEVDVFEGQRWGLTAMTWGLGAALGVGWALLAGPVVAAALLPTFQASLPPSRLVEAGVLVPVTGQLLMVVPMAVLRTRRERSPESLSPESLDGFVLGAAGALGFVLAATLTDLAPQLQTGVFTHRSSTGLLTEALLRGLTVPLVAAAASGLVGAAAWVRWRPVPVSPGRWLTSPVLALAAALAVQVGLGLADLEAPGDGAVLAAHIAAAGLLLVALRVGLHHVLLHEEQEVRVGPPRVCPHCQHIVPETPFCPHCGVAERATSRVGRRAFSPGLAAPGGSAPDLAPGRP